LEHLLLVVGLDHRVDHHDLVAVGGRTGRDLEQLEREEVRAEHLAARRIGAVRQEEDDAFLAMDHQGLGDSRPWACRNSWPIVDTRAARSGGGAVARVEMLMSSMVRAPRKPLA